MQVAKGNLPDVPAGSRFGELTSLEPVRDSGRITFACSCGNIGIEGIRHVMRSAHPTCRDCEWDTREAAKPEYRNAIESRTKAIRDMKRNVMENEQLIPLTPELAAANAATSPTPAEYYDVMYSYLYKRYLAAMSTAGSGQDHVLPVAPVVIVADAATGMEGE